ncbi:MAG TPA: ROK family protein [Ignavibacteriaceae bacterium]|nr:ROK family protein [Ignavibacteriaceae bacterium]
MSTKEKYAIGVDLGGTNIKVGIVSEAGEIVEKASVPTLAEDGPEIVISQIKKGIGKVIPDKNFDIKGIGIGSPGVISIEKGIVENPPNLPGWGKVMLGDILEKEFNVKVVVENDANAAAIGELVFGAGKNFDSFIMITLGTGVGGGIILNKKIYRGDFGAAGEIGHITIDYKGNRCNCGNYGCIETYIGNNYLIKWVSEELANTSYDSKIMELVDNDLDRLTPKIISDAADLKDEYAHSVISKMGLYLGAALASVSNILDVSTYVIGGGVSGLGEPLIKAIENGIKDRVLKSLSSRVKVVPAMLRNDAGVKGASSLVFYNY